MTSVPASQPPAACETDASTVVALLATHGYVPCSQHTPTINAWWSQCGGCDWRGPRRSQRHSDEADHREHLAEVIATAARERVRVVEGERDEANVHAIECERIGVQAIEARLMETARAESAEAAHRALRAIAEDIAYQHAATIDGEYGCCHDEDALRAGGRVPEFDGDEFDPIPDDCPGKQTLDRHLDRIAASGGAR